jgi:predicted oxidoreductase (fatty acid repression mutant protein)
MARLDKKCRAEYWTENMKSEWKDYRFSAPGELFADNFSIWLRQSVETVSAYQAWMNLQGLGLGLTFGLSCGLPDTFLRQYPVP